MLKRKMTAFLLAMALACTTLFAACGSPDSEKTPESTASKASGESTPTTSSTSDEPVELEVYYTKGGFEEPPADNAILKKMEEDTGLKLKWISPPSANYTEQLHLMLSSGDYPDIVAFNLKNDPLKYAEEGILLDLTPYMDSMPDVVNYVWNSEAAMAFYNVDGKQIALPKTTSTKRYNVMIRKDWLDNLNMEIPTTLDEYHEVAKAFVHNDPDGNGKDDTYAIGGLGLDSFDYLLGTFGLTLGETPWNAPDTHCNIYFKDVDGKLVPMVTLPEMKEALTLLKDWYDEGLIDPEYVSQTDAVMVEKYEGSSFGIATYWWNWDAQRTEAMKGAIPDVEIARIAPPVGPTGLSGNRAVPAVVNGVSVMADTEHPEECMKFLNYLHTDEGMMTSYTGVEDLHWEVNDKGETVTTPQFDTDNKWIQWYFLFESEPPLLKVETYLAPSRRSALDWEVIPDDADGIVTQASLEYGSDLQAYVAETFNNMITGKTPIDNFDAFVEEFMARGGQTWTDEVNANRK